MTHSTAKLWTAFTRKKGNVPQVAHEFEPNRAIRRAQARNLRRGVRHG